MTDPRQTKARILADRARRAFEAADQERAAAQRRADAAWTAYAEAARSAGFCANCGNPLDECDCVPMAGGYADRYDGDVEVELEESAGQPG